MAVRVLVLTFVLNLALLTQAVASFRDSVIVLVSRKGYEVDVIKPGRYVVVRNFSGRKVVGRVRVLNRRTLLVGHTVVPIRNIRSITVKSNMYPVAKAIFSAGRFLVIDFTGKMFRRLGFSSTGPAAVLLLSVALIIAVVVILIGLLLMLIAIPGLIVGKKYSVRRWKIYIRPRR